MDTLSALEPYLHHIYATASFFNVICCAYPLIGICSLKGKNKSSYAYYDVIKFSYFCMSFWMAYGICSGEVLPFVANSFGISITGLCLVTYAWVFGEYKKVLSHLGLGFGIVLVFHQLSLEYLVPLASVVTGRLYGFCWEDIVGIKISRNWKKVDLVDCGVNLMNTVVWAVYGLVEKDVFVFGAFFFGFCMYLQIVWCYFYFKYFEKSKVESCEVEKSAKDLQA